VADAAPVLAHQSGPQPVIAYVAVGANLGDRRENIRAAVDALRATQGVRILRSSSLIENPAVGGPADSPPFLNAVAEIQTSLPPRQLLERLLEIERTLGRARREKWGPRVIDLDLILFGDQIVAEPELQVPHPLMHERRFVLEPLVQIAPDVMHPVLKRRAIELFKDLKVR
jgi:2-amino-4-hydroxy-6-hydroxymethyldihydropteridine diphosphokinase